MRWTWSLVVVCLVTVASLCWYWGFSAPLYFGGCLGPWVRNAHYIQYIACYVQYGANQCNLHPMWWTILLKEWTFWTWPLWYTVAWPSSSITYRLWKFLCPVLCYTGTIPCPAAKLLFTRSLCCLISIESYGGIQPPHSSPLYLILIKAFSYLSSLSSVLFYSWSPSLLFSGDIRFFLRHIRSWKCRFL